MDFTVASLAAPEWAEPLAFGVLITVILVGLGVGFWIGSDGLDEIGFGLLGALLGGLFGALVGGFAMFLIYFGSLGFRDPGPHLEDSASALVVAVEESYGLEISDDTAVALMTAAGDEDEAEDLFERAAAEPTGEVIRLGVVEILDDEGGVQEVQLAWASDQWVLMDGEATVMEPATP